VDGFVSAAVGGEVRRFTAPTTGLITIEQRAIAAGTDSARRRDSQRLAHFIGPRLVVPPTASEMTKYERPVTTLCRSRALSDSGSAVVAGRRDFPAAEKGDRSNLPETARRVLRTNWTCPFFRPPFFRLRSGDARRRTLRERDPPHLKRVNNPGWVGCTAFQYSRSSPSSRGDNGTSRSFAPLPHATRSNMRALSMSATRKCVASSKRNPAA
jgi:hypothetical protein